MKLWERVVEACLGRQLTIREQQHEVMVRGSTTAVMFALSVLIEKYREIFTVFLST